MEYTLEEWLRFDEARIAHLVAPRLSTAVIYLNGTRRWFLTQNTDWTNYAQITGIAQRGLSQLFYDHGIQTLLKPLLGYDLLSRGPDYLKLAVDQGLAILAGDAYRNWYHQAEIRLGLYGSWATTLAELGFSQVVEALDAVIQETRYYTRRRLLFGVFADRPLEQFLALARETQESEALLAHYYGQPVGPIDLIVGSGQPAIWDIPFLDFNKASLYFIQAPTFCLDKETLRRILYDHLYQRLNDDDLYHDLTPQAWQAPSVLGLGHRTRKGWISQ